MSVQFENKITMGNVLTAVPLLIAVTVAFTNIQARQDQQAEVIASIAVDVTEAEARIRTVEQANATSTARYESLSQSLGEVKAELRQTNELLRRLIEGRAE